VIRRARQNARDDAALAGHAQALLGAKAFDGAGGLL